MNATAKVTTTMSVRILKVRWGVVTVELEGGKPEMLRAGDTLRVTANADLGMSQRPDSDGFGTR